MNINFPFGTNGKLMVLGVPILKHFRDVLFNTCYLRLLISQSKFSETDISK